MRQSIRTSVKSVGLTMTAPLVGFLLVALFEIILEAEVSKLAASVVNLVVVAPVAFYLFPQKLGVPLGVLQTREWAKKLGMYFPEKGWKHIILGFLLAACTLSGMLVASILTGKYEFDPSTINLPHIVFSLNPGIWEELFYRGVKMVLLLGITKSFRKAFIIQVVLFGVMHIKGFDVWAFVDVFSVMVISLGFTYTAYKTRSLVAGIISHYFHDAFIFAVQLPGGETSSTADSLVFYGLLWVMVGVGCLITKLAAEKMGVRGSEELYMVDGGG